MKYLKIAFLGFLGLFPMFSAWAAGPAFDVIPLWGIKVNYEGLQYSNISLKTMDASAIIGNNIPQNLKFTIAVEKPFGFNDSNKMNYYGAEVTVSNGSSKPVSYSKDIFNGTGVAPNGGLNDISLSWTFDAQTKVGSKIKIVTRVFDRTGGGYIMFEYNLVVVAASKRLTNKVIAYTSKDSKGMRSNSVGLHFNFFEFAGLTGNNFIYKIKKGEKIAFTLKGLEGWKLVDGKAAPLGVLKILNAKGETVEENLDVLESTVGHSMPGTKKEIEVKHKLANALESGQMYFVYLSLKDKNTPKNILELVVKIYVE